MTLHINPREILLYLKFMKLSKTRETKFVLSLFGKSGVGEVAEVGGCSGQVSAMVRRLRVSRSRFSGFGAVCRLTNQ